MKSISRLPSVALMIMIFCIPTVVFGQGAKGQSLEERIFSLLSITAKGTGQTTDQIATVSVTNNSTEPIVISPQTFYIPSNDNDQSYVGRIPEGITIAPGETVDIPVYGNCTDAHKPPVTAGKEMALHKWVPVSSPATPTGPPPAGAGTIVSIVSTAPVPAFTPENVPEITHAPGYKPTGPHDPNEIDVTWPGTDKPVGGIINPDKNPRTFAPLIVRIVEAIEDATSIIQKSPDYLTPFSNDPQKEREAIIQQTVWVCMGALTGDPYKKTDFASNVYDQFTANSGLLVNMLPKEEKENLDTGIEAFWNVFMATGIEAKVISNSKDYAYVSDIRSEESGPVYQERPCDTVKICIEVFVMARKDGDNYDLGIAYASTNLPESDPNSSRYRVRRISVPKSAFTLAHGALADITNNQEASAMVSNIYTMLDSINVIYQKCCVKFYLSHVYAMDPDSAVVTGSGTKFNRWLNPHPLDEDGEPAPEWKTREPIDNLGFLDAAKQFVDTHSGRSQNNCLKMFLGPKFKGPTNDCAGFAKCPGSCCVFDLSNINPRNPGIIAAHELGHNLGLEHEDKSDGPGHNLMEPSHQAGSGGDSKAMRGTTFLNAAQCSKIRQHVERIGEPQLPPALQRNATPSQSGQGAREGNPAPQPAPPSNPEPRPAPQPEPAAPQPEKEKKECPCPEARITPANLNDINQLQNGQSATAESEVIACCAKVKLSTEVTKVAERKYTFTWKLVYEITDPECFVSIEFDRFYISKKFNVRYNAKRFQFHIPVSAVEFIEGPVGTSTLRGHGGFSLNYDKVGDNDNRRFPLEGVQFTPDDDENSLNLFKEVASWQVLIGGRIVCKKGRETTAVPFHFIFRRDRDIDLRSGARALPESEVKGDARGGISRSPVYQNAK